MKRMKIIGFSVKVRELGERVLLSAGLDPSEGEWDTHPGNAVRWDGRLRADDSRWKALVAAAEAAGRKPFVSEVIDYTEEELAAAQLLYIQQFQVDSQGETGPDHGNEYDYSDACPICLSGARLIPPFRMRESDLPKKRPVAQTYAGEYLVHDRIASELGEIPGSEQWLVPVEARRSKKLLPWFVILPAATMPRMHPSTRGIVHTTSGRTSTCSRCARDCWGTTYEEAPEIVFSRSAIELTCGKWIQPGASVPDAAGTWERWGPGTRPDGPSGKRRVAQPYILLSQRVARVLREHADKHLWLVPVTLVD